MIAKDVDIPGVVGDLRSATELTGIYPEPGTESKHYHA